MPAPLCVLRWIVPRAVGPALACLAATCLVLAAGCAGSPTVRRSEGGGPAAVRPSGPAAAAASETGRAGSASALAAALHGMAEGISAEEAGRLARVAWETSPALAGEYGAHRPAWLHNMMVNAHLRRRGLCWHYAEDLQARLDQEQFATLVVQRGVAHLGTPKEHNAVVITGHGQRFADGIVLDAWRDAGRLYWGPVTGDRYRWQLRAQGE